MKLFCSLIIAVLLVGVSFSADAQRKSKPLKKRRSQVYNYQSKLRLPGDMLVGAHYVYSPIGFGVSTDFTYFYKSNLFLEASTGYFSESYKGANVVSIPVHLGVKYQIYDFYNFTYAHAGVAFKGNMRRISDFEPTTELKSFIMGPAVFGELSIGLVAGFSAALRAEQVFILTEKVEIDNKDRSYGYVNLSIGLRYKL